MLQMKDSLWLGVGIGFVLPLLAYFLTEHTEAQQIIFKTTAHAFYLIAAAINMILLRLCYREKTYVPRVGNGILLTTFLGLLLFLYNHKLAM